VAVLKLFLINLSIFSANPSTTVFIFSLNSSEQRMLFSSRVDYILKAIHLSAWGYGHKSVNHGRGEFARDEDGDGFCEVHVNTMEGFWSLLRSWLRPHRGISQEKLPLYLGFFEFVHNVRKRGKSLLGALIELLVS